MSGRRCKALRREFLRTHGRTPNPAQWGERKVNRRTRDGKHVVPVREIVVSSQSEWRQVKRAYMEQQRRAA